jgi:hypothetical protein
LKSLEFMGKEWDRIGNVGKSSHGGFSDGKFKGFRLASYNASANVKCEKCGRWRWDWPGAKCDCPEPQFPNVRGIQARYMQEWHEGWLTAAYQVLRGGGFIAAFSGTRTFHRLAAAMSSVGFADVHLDAWAYGSGFPKSLSIGKAIDKGRGAKREVIGYGDSGLHHAASITNLANWNTDHSAKGNPITAPATPEAKVWEGWGTALKPAWEPILVGRKPV